MRPAVNVTTRDNAPPSSIPTDVGTGFAVGITEAGPETVAVSDLVQNMDEVKDRFFPNDRDYVAGNLMFDSIEQFFAEGGNRLYISRVFGATPVRAKVDLLDASAGVTSRLVASNVGEWGNGMSAVVKTHTEDAAIPSGSYTITLIDNLHGGAVLETSPVLTTPANVFAWAATVDEIDSSFSASALIPVAGTFPLTTGTSDPSNITNTQWTQAFGRMPTDLGPGIIFAPGMTTDAIHKDAADAALTSGRGAFLDGPDTTSADTLINSSIAVTDSSLKRSRFSGLFTPWLIVAGLVDGTTRTVPPSGAVAGRFARSISEGHTANEPAAGDNGELRTVLNVKNTFTDADRAKMNAQGVNVIREVFNVPKVYGWRTTADPVNDKRWINLGNSLMHRQIVALAGEVGERFIFRQIDGQGHLIAEFVSALTGEVCMPLFLSGSLYGATPQDAFKVDGGPSINTVSTIAANELHAVISVKMSPFGEEVDIDIVKYLVTEAIPA